MIVGNKPHLQLDLLKIVLHGIARARPLGEDVHHSQDSLFKSLVWMVIFSKQCQQDIFVREKLKYFLSAWRCLDVKVRNRYQKAKILSL